MSIQRPNTLLGECLAEFIGTGLLIFGVGCVRLPGAGWRQLRQWEISPLPGAWGRHRHPRDRRHLWPTWNPAVTLAPMTFCGFDKRKVVPFIIAQIAGAFASPPGLLPLWQPLHPVGNWTHNVVRGSVESLAPPASFSTYPNACSPTCRRSRSSW